MEYEHVGVCVLLLNASNQVLLGKRKNAYKAGMWGLPGGRVEKTEALKLCAFRELLEETGVRGNNFQYVGVVRDLQGNANEKGYNFIHFVFFCRDYSGDVETKEPEKCEGWKWFSFDEIPKNILPGHKAGIEMFLNKKISYRDLV